MWLSPQTTFLRGKSWRVLTNVGSKTYQLSQKTENHIVSVSLAALVLSVTTPSVQQSIIFLYHPSRNHTSNRRKMITSH